MSTYTPSLGLELITPGSQAGLWGNTTNNSLNLIDQAITGVTEVNFAGASGSTYTLTDYNGAADEARSAVLNVTGTASGANTIVIPNKQKTYLVRNFTTKAIRFQTASFNDYYDVEAGNSILIFCDGNNNVYTGIASPSVGTLTVSAGGTGSSTFGAGGFIKSAGGTNALTAVSKVTLSSDVTGTLPVANGGTGTTSFTSGALLLGNGASPVATLTGGANNGYVPTWSTALNTWVPAAPASAGVTNLTAGTGILVNGGVGPVSNAVTISNNGVTSIVAGSGISVTSATGAVEISATGTAGVTTFSGGTTGLTPSAPTPGAVTLGGKLSVENGGTGQTTLTAGSIVVGNGTGSVAALAPGVVNTVVASNGTAWVAQGIGATLGGLTGVLYGNGTSAPTVASAAQIVNAIGSTAVQLATTASSATTAGSATSATNLVSGGTIASTVTATTQSPGTNTLQVATCAFVQSSLSGYAALAGSQTFTGAKTFTGGITSGAYNFTPANSIFYNAFSSVISITNGSANYIFNNAGTATAVLWSSTSDARIKENVQPIQNGLNTIQSLNPVKFSFTKDKLNAPNHYGLIAQELEQVVPEVVTESAMKQDDVENVKAVSYSELIPILIKAVQELKAEVDALKAAK